MPVYAICDVTTEHSGSAAKYASFKKPTQNVEFLIYIYFLDMDQYSTTYLFYRCFDFFNR